MPHVARTATGLLLSPTSINKAYSGLDQYVASVRPAVLGLCAEPLPCALAAC